MLKYLLISITLLLASCNKHHLEEYELIHIGGDEFRALVVLETIEDLHAKQELGGASNSLSGNTSTITDIKELINTIYPQDDYYYVQSIGINFIIPPEGYVFKRKLVSGKIIYAK